MYLLRILRDTESLKCCGEGSLLLKRGGGAVDELLNRGGMMGAASELPRVLIPDDIPEEGGCSDGWI